MEVILGVCMGVLTTRDLAFVSVSAAIWAVLNITIMPVFWAATGLPILCDLVGVALFAVTAWWVRKPGAVALMGGVATLLNFIMRPGAFQFLGFTAAAIVYDIVISLIGYDRCLRQRTEPAVIVGLSIGSAFIAGAVIGSLFMPPVAVNSYGGILLFAGLHAAGGGAGGLLGLALVRGLSRRGLGG
jgi:riboflavin transporter FmnP